jgi:hypothetical protein
MKKQGKAKNKGETHEQDEVSNKGSGVEWAYAYTLRPLCRKQQGTIGRNGQGLSERGAFGFTFDERLIVLVCREHRERAAKSYWAWVQESV